MPRTSKVRDCPEALAPAIPARDAVLFPGQIHTLHVAREGSKRAIRQAIADAKPVFVAAQKDQAVEDPQPADLHRVGTLCEPLQALPLPDGSLRVAFRCLRRGEAKRYNRRAGALTVSYVELEERGESGVEAEATMRAAVDAFSQVVEKDRQIPPETMETVIHQDSPGALADAIAHHLPLHPSQKQALLEELNTTVRLSQIFELLKREAQILKVKKEISERVDREFASSQREVFLREQLKTIQSELAALGDEDSEIQRLRLSIEKAQLPPAAREKALREVARLETAPPQSPEAMVIRNYVDWMANLPWTSLSPDRLDVRYARTILDEAHFGLEQVKDRILDFLAVRQVSQSLRGPILCFVGPPGVGKTSAGRSIAEALGREFIRISLGGLRDEAEIRGHRRTYIGALPGKILQSLRQCGTRNPVIVLDEIDKLASDWRGDPSSALLEALDPAQNERFTDHFLEVPFDLSAVIFIATANVAEGIPPALRDRMEVVRFTSYTDEERVRIAQDFILPRQLALHGLTDRHCRVSPSAVRALATRYTREAGVRDLERIVGALCRKVARKITESPGGCKRVFGGNLEKYIGPPRVPILSRLVHGEVGAANSLVVTEYGGEVIAVEALLLEPAKAGGTLKLTGNVGAVMRESAEAALSFIRSEGSGITLKGVLDRDVHIHVPDNAIPKEGPSAGLTIAVALASVWTGRPVRAGVALTGEITLRGKVLGVGGVREKLIAASREGLTTVILPAESQTDLVDVPKQALAKLNIVFVETIQEALAHALTPAAEARAVIERPQVPAG